MRSTTIYLHALTPVHSGTGHESASIVDLPVARETATGWPIIPASSLKGVLKDVFRKKEPEIFGNECAAGKVSFGDQRLLALPVRSYRGTFAWVTCPLVLHRWERDRSALELPPLCSEADHSAVESGLPDTAAVAPGSALVENGKLYLEDLDLVAGEKPAAGNIARALAAAVFETEQERVIFTERFAVIPNDVFDYLCETSLEIVARVALDDSKKTVKPGCLWYEEAVPAEAIFCGVAFSQEERFGAALEACLRDVPPIQIGGQASVGRGLCRVRVN